MMGTLILVVLVVFLAAAIVVVGLCIGRIGFWIN